MFLESLRSLICNVALVVAMLGFGQGFGFGGAAVPPEPASASTISGAIYRIRVTFDSVLMNGTGTTLADWVAVNPSLHATKQSQSPVAVDNTGSNDTVDLTFATPFFQGSSPTIAYTATTNPLKGANGAAVANFSALAVTNLSSLPAPSIYIDLRRSDSFTQSAGVITALTNLMTNTSYATAGAGGAPAYDATGLGGFPCAVGNVAGSKCIRGTIEAALVTALSAADRPYTFFVVADPVTPDLATTMVGFWHTADTDPRLIIGTSATGNGRWIGTKSDDVANAITVSSTVDISNTMQAVLWRSTGTAASCYVNSGAANPNGASQNINSGIDLNAIAFFARGVDAQAQFSPAKVGVWAIWCATDIGTADAKTELLAWSQAGWGVGA